MKLSRRTAIPLIIGGGIAAAIVGNYFVSELFKEKADEEYESAKLGTDDKKQKLLKDSLEMLGSENISEVVYDPTLEKSRENLRKILKRYAKESEIEKLVKESTKKDERHSFCVIDIVPRTGNGEKRPVFARKEVYGSQCIKKIEDIISCLRHEDEHARNERCGYEFKDKILKAYELIEILNERDFRAEVFQGIYEIPAYAVQLDSIIHGKDKTSRECADSVKQNLKELSRIL